MKKFKGIVIVAPAKVTCENIFLTVGNPNIPIPFLLKNSIAEINEAIRNLLENGNGFGVVAGTGTGKTVSMRHIAQQVIGRDDITISQITRDEEYTAQKFACDVIVVTPGIFFQYLQMNRFDSDYLYVFDEIHMTSDELEFGMSLINKHCRSAIFASGTVDPAPYMEHLNCAHLIKCDMQNETKIATILPSRESIEAIIEANIPEFVKNSRGVAVFLSTRDACEKMAARFSDKIHTGFYHGGVPASVIREYVTGKTPKPFMIFMTVAGASSLNIEGLTDVIIEDKMFGEVLIGGSMVLSPLLLDNNTFLQMKGRVHGRATNGKVFISTNRSIDWSQLKPCSPEFKLGGSLEKLAMSCARLHIDVADLELIGGFDRSEYSITLARLRQRGLIHPTEMKLTEYGQRVNRMPTSIAWGEMLACCENEDNGFKLMLSLMAAAPSLKDLVLRERNIGNFVVSGSDNMTSYNIIVGMLQLFGTFLRDTMTFSLKGYNTDLKKSIGEYCKEKGISSRGVNESLQAFRAICKAMNIRMPYISDFVTVKKGDENYERVTEHFAKVQSFIAIRNGDHLKISNLKAAQHSTCNTYSGCGLCTVDYWSLKGYVNANFEGTHIPTELVQKYGKFVPMCVEEVGMEITISEVGEFAGEKMGQQNRIATIAEVKKLGWEKQCYDLMLPKLVSSSYAPEFFKSYVIDNNKVITMYEDLRVRSEAAIEKIQSDFMKLKFEKVLTENEILNFSDLEAFLLDPDNCEFFKIKIGDLIDLGKQLDIVLKNPDQVTLLGSPDAYPVTYYQSGGDYRAQIELPAELVWNCNAEGDEIKRFERIFEIKCQGQTATSILELRKKLDATTAEKSFNEAKSAHEHASWISNTSEVMTHLPEMLNEVVYATSRIDGNAYTAFVGLHSDSDPDFKVLLYKTRKEAEDVTRTSVVRLVQKATKDLKNVPNEEPFKSSGYVTDLGRAFEQAVSAKIEELAQFMSDNLSEIKTLLGRIETLALEVSGLKLGFAAELTDKTNLFETLKSRVSEISSLDMVYHERYDFANNFMFEVERGIKTSSMAEFMVKIADGEAKVDEIKALSSERVIEFENLKTEAGKIRTQLEEITNQVTEKGYDLLSGDTANEAAWHNRRIYGSLGEFQDLQTAVNKANAFLGMVSNEIAETKLRREREISVQTILADLNSLANDENRFRGYPSNPDMRTAQSLASRLRNAAYDGGEDFEEYKSRAIAHIADLDNYIAETNAKKKGTKKRLLENQRLTKVIPLKILLV